MPPIRAVGGDLSWSDIALGNGVDVVAVYMNEYDHVSMDRDIAMIGSGAKLGDIISTLASKGRVIPYLPYMAGQTLGGAIATASHGSNKYGSIVSGITEVTAIPPSLLHILVNGGRRIVPYVDAKHAVMIPKETSVTLGDFILHTVSMRTIPDIPVSMDVKEGVFNIMQLYDAYRMDPTAMSMVIYLTPSSGHMRVVRINTAMKGVPLSSCINAPYEDPYAPHVLKAYTHRIEQEIGIAVTDLLSALESMYATLRTYCNAYKDLILIRFIPADDVWMSMAYGKDTAFISMSMDGGEGISLEPFRAMDANLYDYDGRSHWGKVNFMDQRRIERLYPMYSMFQDVRSSYDPKGILSVSDRVLS